MRKREQTSGPIKAPPGTPDYERQFKYQALVAADAALRLWVVRIPCGILGVMFVALALFMEWPVPKLSGNIFIFLSSIYVLFAVELLTICFCGKSWSVRFALAGVRKDSLAKEERRDDR